MAISDPKKFLTVVAAASFFSGFSTISILLYSNPENKSISILVFLYLSLYIFSLGIFCFLGLLVRRLYSKDIFSVSLSHSLRQALLLSSYLTICLILSTQNLFMWWVGLCLFLPFAVIEIFINLKI